jgi:peptide/nickel transport system permease protein
MSEPGAIYANWWGHWQSVLYHMVLPVFTFAIAYVGEYHLIMRSSLTGVMTEDFVLTARAKGLPDNKVLWRHVVPNAMLPTVTLVMMNLGFVMSGTILTESVFNWPGMGRMAWQAAQDRDFPVIMGIAILAAVFVRCGTLLQRVVYVAVNPRASKE